MRLSPFKDFDSKQLGSHFKKYLEIYQKPCRNPVILSQQFCSIYFEEEGPGIRLPKLQAKLLSLFATHLQIYWEILPSPFPIFSPLQIKSRLNGTQLPSLFWSTRKQNRFYSGNGEFLFFLNNIVNPFGLILGVGVSQNPLITANWREALWGQLLPFTLIL